MRATQIVYDQDDNDGDDYEDDESIPMYDVKLDTRWRSQREGWVEQGKNVSEASPGGVKRVLHGITQD